MHGLEHGRLHSYAQVVEKFFPMRNGCNPIPLYTVKSGDRKVASMSGSKQLRFGKRRRKSKAVQVCVYNKLHRNLVCGIAYLVMASIRANGCGRYVRRLYSEWFPNRWCPDSRAYMWITWQLREMGSFMVSVRNKTNVHNVHDSGRPQDGCTVCFEGGAVLQHLLVRTIWWQGSQLQREMCELSQISEEQGVVKVSTHHNGSFQHFNTMLRLHCNGSAQLQLNTSQEFG
uniref:Uncharacterized protein n=1 Tax=Timema bartmani TaxID=61472 RepID=A0A7R9I0Z4_9NEOP|nr:unnamed protein product [Timema bartmani]